MYLICQANLFRDPKITFRDRKWGRDNSLRSPVLAQHARLNALGKDAALMQLCSL